MERSSIDRLLGRLSRAYGNRQFRAGEKESYYENLESLPALNGEQVDQWAERLINNSRHFPWPAICLQHYQRAGVPAVKRSTSRNCKCGICPGDGFVTIFQPEYVEAIALGEDWPRCTFSCCLACSEGGFYKMALWRRKYPRDGRPDTVVAPTLPVPSFGRTISEGAKRHREYVEDWLRSHSVGGMRRSEFDQWNEG